MNKTVESIGKCCFNMGGRQYHLNVVRLMDKPVESIGKHHLTGVEGNNSNKLVLVLRNLVHLEANPVTSNFTNSMSPCNNCGMKLARNQYIATGHTCFKCNKIGYFASVCRSSSSSSTHNTRQFNKF